LFGRFLVSLPYLNYGGVQAEDEAIGRLLVDRAVALADELNVRFLELRHESPLVHSALNHSRTDKVHMYLDLPGASEELWGGLSAKVRNQVRKAQKQSFSLAWGTLELLDEFYAVFSRNMRDLGTPVFGKRLFTSLLETFPGRAEICVVRDGQKPVAAAWLAHGWGITEVPSASTLRSYNPSCVNMLLYWHLLERTIQRGHRLFDFGRSSLESNTYRFKKQWGARPVPAEWQYYLRRGGLEDTRKESARNQRLIRLWQRLPVSLTRLIGPVIVRGIP
jgi:FemAB-related protein (PEP-CTERM system-associated)